MERFTDTPIKKNRTQRVIGVLGIPALNASRMLTVETAADVAHHFGGSEDNYVKLAILRFLDFSTHARMHSFAPGRMLESEVSERNRTKNWLTDNSSVRHGFRVCGYMLGYSVEAYKDHLRQQAKSPDTNELRALLLSKKTLADTVMKLAMMPNSVNNSWEDVMALYDIGYEANKKYGWTPLEVVSYRGEQALRFTLPLMAEAMTQAPRSLPTNVDDHCLAHVYIPKLWSSMVDEALVNPLLIPTDLRLID